MDTDAHAENHLTMPQHVSLHEAGLPQPPRLQELEAKKSIKKAHVTSATKTTRAISLFTLFSLVTDVKIDMPAYNIPLLLLLLSVPFVILMRLMNSTTVCLIVSVHMLLALSLWT